MNDIIYGIVNKLYVIPGIIIAMSVHEFGHALVAYKLGDDSQKYMGRLTLDPLKHIDLIGFLMLLLIGFGWAKPVQFNPRKFKNLRRDESLVAVAGAAMNLITSIIFTVILGVYLYLVRNIEASWVSIFLWIIQNTIYINLVLMIFNLIPIPPLDGHYILGNFVGNKLWEIYYKYADIFRIVILVLVVTGVVGRVVGPLVKFMYYLLITGMTSILYLLV